MLPAGLLGDRYGRKRVLLIALVLFAVGSLACAYSPTPLAFIAARSLLGGAGAGVIVMALSTITVLIPEEQRPRAIGVWAAANFVALPLGPVLGGWLLTHYWWGWVFLMNVPVAALGLLAVVALVPESRSAERPRIDLVGTALFCGGLAAATYGLIKAGRDGWTTRGHWRLCSLESLCWSDSVFRSGTSAGAPVAGPSSTSTCCARLDSRGA